MQESILATTRDALYGWTAERLVQKQTALGQPSFLYFFDHGYPAEDDAGLHAFHASELPFVFGTFDGTPPLWPKIPVTARQKRTVRRDDRLLDQLRRNRQAGGAGRAGLAAYGSASGYMDVHGRAASGRESVAGDVQAE